MREFLRRLCGDRTGATAIEYGLIAALIAVATIAGLTSVGVSLNTLLRHDLYRRYERWRLTAQSCYPK